MSVLLKTNSSRAKRSVPSRGRACVKTLFPSAKGAKCESLGHRPRWDRLKIFFSAEGAKCGWPLHNHKRFRTTRVYFAPSALPRICEPLPGALPQAVTSRAFGAGKQSFHTGSVAGGFWIGVEAD